MTVLVAHREVGMASDTLVTDAVPYHTHKVFELPGACFGSSGDVPYTDQFDKWMRGAGRAPKMPRDADFSGLLITESGIYLYGPSLTPSYVDEAYYAIGSGAVWAIAALDFGATLIEAVEYACQKEKGCDTPVQLVALPRGSHIPKEG